MSIPLCQSSCRWVYFWKDIVRRARRDDEMAHSPEWKAAVLKKMLPSHNKVELSGSLDYPPRVRFKSAWTRRNTPASQAVHDAFDNRSSILKHLRVGTAPMFLLAGAVIAPGRPVVDTNVKKVQHPTGGVVGELRVQNGDEVKGGRYRLREDRLRPGEGRLGVHDPALLPCRRQVAQEFPALGEMSKGAEEGEQPRFVHHDQPGQEQPAEQLAEHPGGKEERRARRYPPGSV